MENKNIVYVVVVDDVCEESFWSNVEVFRSFKNAKAHMDKLIEDFELEDLKDGMIVNRDRLSYSCYEAGCYSTNHYDITISKREVK